MLDRLDPQAKALLEQLAAFTAGQPQSQQLLGTAEQIAATRAGYHQVDQLAGETEPVLHVFQRQISGSHGSITIRLYQPQEATNLPVLVYLHGGGT